MHVADFVQPNFYSVNLEAYILSCPFLREREEGLGSPTLPPPMPFYTHDTVTVAF